MPTKRPIPKAPQKPIQAPLRPAANAPLTAAQTIAGAEAITAQTPNYEIERLLMAVDRHKRAHTPMPKGNTYHGNWEWVWFEITRGLRRVIRTQEEQLRQIQKLVQPARPALKRAA